MPNFHPEKNINEEIVSIKSSPFKKQNRALGSIAENDNKCDLEASGSIPFDGDDVDGLLKWAKQLPGEDQFKASGSSFFKRGLI